MLTATNVRLPLAASDCLLSFTVGEIKDGVLRIGNTCVTVHSPETKMKVPDVLFYENSQVSEDA